MYLKLGRKGICLRRKTNKKHIGLKVFLVILFFLILVCVAIAVTQRDNISAVIDASKYSKVDIQKQMDDTKTEVQKTLQNLYLLMFHLMLSENFHYQKHYHHLLDYQKNFELPEKRHFLQ